MTTQTGGIKVRILGDDSDLENKLASSTKRLVKWGAAAAAAATTGVAVVTKHAIQSAKEIDNLSRLIGISSEEFRKQAFAARTAGIEQDKLADIYKDVNDKIGDFLQNQAGPLKDYFENIAPLVGQTADEFRGLAGPEALQKYVDGLEAANLSQEDMTFYMEAIASDATLLIPLLRNSGAEMARLSDDAERLGVALSETDTQNLVQAGRSVSELGALASSAANVFASELAPVITEVAENLQEQFLAAGSSTEETIREVARTVADVFAEMLEHSAVAVGFIENNSDIAKFGLLGYMLLGKKGALLGSVVGSMFEGVEKNLKQAGLKNSEALDPINIQIEKIHTAMDNLSAMADLSDFIGGGSGAGRDAIAEQYTVLQLNLSDLQAQLKEGTPAFEEYNEMFVKGEEASTSLSDAMLLVAASIREARAAQDEGPIMGVEPEEPDLGPMVDPGKDPILEAEQARLDALLDAYEQYGRARIGSGEDFSKTELEKAQEFADQMVKIDEARFGNQVRGASSFFGDLSSLMDTESRALFEIGKVAAISQATADGISAGVSSFKFGASIGGPLLGAAFAAASATATGVQIAALANTNFGSRGATAAPTPSVSIPDAGGAVAQGQQAETEQNSTIFVENIDDDSLLSGSMVRKLIEKINELHADGTKVVLT